jgi:RNA polymerase sigma-70 factor (ECF subfamily)
MRGGSLIACRHYLSQTQKGRKQFVTIFFAFIFLTLQEYVQVVNSNTLLHADEREIINGLLETGTSRRKSEEQLFNRFAYFINEGMHKQGLLQEQAFDVYADTVLSAIEKIRNRSFEGRSSLKTWIYQIFHNKCVDLLRKTTTNKYSIHRTLSMDDMLTQLSDPAKTVVQKLSEQTDWDQLKQNLMQIGDNCRQMLTQWADGYTDKEIAETMNYKSADVVKTSRLRCLEKLRQLYKRN